MRAARMATVAVVGAFQVRKGSPAVEAEPVFLILTRHLSTARGVFGSLNFGVRGGCPGPLQPGRPV